MPFDKGEERDAVVDKTRAGCLIGSAMGGMHSFSTATENLVKEYPSWIGMTWTTPSGGAELKREMVSCRACVRWVCLVS